MSCKNNIAFSPSTDITIIDIDLTDGSFFKIFSGSSKLTIYSMTIYFLETGIGQSNSDIINSDKIRINPVTFIGTLQSGTSSVLVPTKIENENGVYVVKETKKYTYYSYSYICDNPSFASTAAMTSPEDVCAYYNAFKEFPANYVAKKKFSAAKQYFGEDTRCVSTYNRTNGYVTNVPYFYDDGFQYHEFDIAGSASYSSNLRGVVRVVAFEYGFSSTNYDSSPVCVFTDDHYGTFSEYLNYGGYFGDRLDSEMTVFGYQYNSAQTIVL